MPDPTHSDAQLRQAAQDSMNDPSKIRERVRALTLQALRERQFNVQAFRDVMAAMTEGISAGASTQGDEVKGALKAAFSGLDEALTRAAHASSLAVKELAARGRDFGETDLKQALNQLRSLETDFLHTWTQVSESAGDAVREEMRSLMTHAQRTGTDTGRVVGATLREFTHRMGVAWMQTQLSGMESARVLGGRFAQAASGFLTAMSETMAREDRPRAK